MECHHNPLQDGESARIWRADDIGDMELLHARYITHAFARHTHAGVAVGTIEEGAESFYYQGAMHTAVAGQIIVFNSDEAHSGQGADERGWRFRMFYIDPRLLQKALHGSSDKQRGTPLFTKPILDDPGLALLLRGLHISLETEESDLRRQSTFLHTFAQLAERHAESSYDERPLRSEKAVVKKIQHYLEDNYKQNVTLDALAALSGLSPYHLVRVFRAEVGLPPHAYLEQIRINRSKRLLRSRKPIADVAFLTGFSDQSHFNRHFKRMTGVTPGQYRLTIAPKVRMLL